jgi:RP/EB family microtubule-associated protein
MANIGMMEGAYFVGRVELLNWVNDLLKLDYTKVEQACTGAAYCQIMDALYPGKVPLSKVNFNAKHEYEYLANFKVLQNVFDKLGIDKTIDVTKIVKGKYQDNLEFLQWMKRYFDLNYSGGEYNALERRNQKAPPSTQKTSTTSSASGIKKSPSVTGATPSSSNIASSKPKSSVPLTKKAVTPVTKPSEASKPTHTSTDEKANQKIQELTQSITELKMNTEAVEKERDFYFSKLRDIEILCQQHEDQNMEIIQKIFKILYATDEEGFAANAETSEEPQVDEQPQEEIESF